MKLPGRQHLEQKRIFWRRTTFSAPERHGRNRRCDGKVWTDWRTERERGKGTPPGRRGYTDAGTGHGVAAPGKEKGMPVVRMLQISPVCDRALTARRQGSVTWSPRLCDKSTVGTWEAPVPAAGGERNAGRHRFGKRCTAVGTVMPTLFPLT